MNLIIKQLEVSKTILLVNYREVKFTCLFSGRLSLHANQKSQTHNVILGGYAVIAMFDENGEEMYVEQSLG